MGEINWLDNRVHLPEVSPGPHLATLVRIGVGERATTAHKARQKTITFVFQLSKSRQVLRRTLSLDYTRGSALYAFATGMLGGLLTDDGNPFSLRKELPSLLGKTFVLECAEASLPGWLEVQQALPVTNDIPAKAKNET